MSGNKGEGGYVFVSHSHDDIKVVRELRNILEENNMDALCFFLKCLTDDAEVFELIKREIDARKHFIFVESENSRKSDWVRREREYVQQCPGKIIQRVSLEDIVSSPKTVADKIMYNLRIFVSFRKRDHAAVNVVLNELKKQDYQLWYDDFLTSANRTELIDAHLKEACTYGAVVLFLTEHSLEPHHFQMAYEYPRALELGGFVIPVWIGECPWESVQKKASEYFRWINNTVVIDGHGDLILAAQKITEVIREHIIQR